MSVPQSYCSPIYNHVELRLSLERAGFGFRTDSDAEAVLHAYRQYGEGCVKHLNGMFAFALHDDPWTKHCTRSIAPGARGLSGYLLLVAQQRYNRLQTPEDGERESTLPVGTMQNAQIGASSRIRIKFVSKNPIDHAHFRELPHRHGGLHFVLDPSSRHYDWFVVYDDLPSACGERHSMNTELLACSARNTMLLTYEPSSIKYYGSDYTDQFSYVLTSHEPAILRHGNRYDTPPVGRWYYGDVVDALQHDEPPEKTKNICIFLATKRTRLPMHRRRVRFQEDLIRLVPEIALYGRDICHLPKKANCLDHYRYSIAVENHIGRHHWTEKLSDCFLAYCLPFYSGCPNASDYFPEGSFIPIDVDDPQGAAKTIRKALADAEYEKRLPAIVEARRRVLEDYNLANTVGDVIMQSEQWKTVPAPVVRTDRARIHSRRRMILQGPGAFLRYTFGKIGSRRWRAG